MRFAFQEDHLSEFKENILGTHTAESREMSKKAKAETQVGRLKTRCLQWAWDGKKWGDFRTLRAA